MRQLHLAGAPLIFSLDEESHLEKRKDSQAKLKLLFITSPLRLLSQLFLVGETVGVSLSEELKQMQTSANAKKAIITLCKEVKRLSHKTKI